MVGGTGGMEGKQEGQEEGTAIETQVMSPWIPVTKRLEGLRSHSAWVGESLTGRSVQSSDLSL